MGNKFHKYFVVGFQGHALRFGGVNLRFTLEV